MQKSIVGALVLPLFVILNSVSTSGCFAAVQSGSTARHRPDVRVHSGTDTVRDEQLLRSQAESYAKAFSSADAGALVRMWTEDGTYTDTAGRQIRGRAELERYFAAGFKRLGARPLEVVVDSIWFPAPDIAIEDGRTRVLTGPNAGAVSRYQVFHVRVGGTWQMAAVSDVDYLPAGNVSLADFEWLIGNWTGVSSSGGSIHIKSDWLANRNFISMQYRSDLKDAAQDLQLIGRDAGTGKIASWHFDVRGGHGYGTWIKDGQSLIESAHSIEPNGIKGSGIYEIRKVGDKAFTWRSTGRASGGRSWPDTEEITVTRDQ